MEHYVPNVSEADIDRIVRREYSPELHRSIHEMIGSDAPGYWREIISEAEYPNYTKKMFRIERLPAQEKEQIIERDKSQYLKWLEA